METGGERMTDRNQKARSYKAHELLQNRRRYIELIRGIEKIEVNIGFQERNINILQIQLDTEELKSYQKEELKLRLDSEKDRLKDFHIALNNQLEDFFFFMSDKTKGFPTAISDHYQKVRDFYYKEYKGD